MSNDGKLCQWSYGKLNEPIVNFQLKQMALDNSAGAAA
jgi:hypothetical protein